MRRLSKEVSRDVLRISKHEHQFRSNARMKNDEPNHPRDGTAVYHPRIDIAVDRVVLTEDTWLKKRSSKLTIEKTNIMSIIAKGNREETLTTR